MVILQLCRWKFSHKEILYSRLHAIEIEFYSENKTKNRFSAILWGRRGNVCTPSIARWKARSRLPIRHD